MKRKILGASAAYLSGLFFASFFTGLREALLLSAAIVLVVFIGRKRGFRRGDYVMLTVSFVTACAVMCGSEALYRSRIMEYEGKRGSFSGRITDMRDYSGEKTSYTLQGKIDGRVSARITYYGSYYDAQYGDIIGIKDCRFDSPGGDYLFDAESYYRSQRIFLQAESANGVTVKRTGSRPIINFFADYRDRMIGELHSHIGVERGDFLAGMIFGEKQGIDRDVKTALYRVGIGHVLSVSGLHVSILVVAIMQLFGLLHINKYISFVAMDLLVAALILMANSPISAIRAAIMMNFVYSARLFRRQNDTITSLAAAALIICLVNPYAIFSSGFLLSVSGTFGIGVFGPYMVREMDGGGIFRRFLKSIMIMVCTSLSVLPLSMMYFEETSLLSPISNVLIMPICSLAMLIGMAYVFTGGIVSLLGASGVLIDIMLGISDSLARLSFSHFSCGSRELMAAAFGAAFIVIIVYLTVKSRTAVGVSCTVLCAVMLIASGIYSRLRYDSCIAAVVGRGSNAAVVVSYQGSTYIIDLSGHYKASAYVRKYLMENGISDVDAVMLTEKYPSQQTSYLNALEYNNVGEWIMFTGDGISSESGAIDVAGNELSVKKSGYLLNVDERTLTLKLGEQCAVIAPVGTQQEPNDGITVFYGNIPKRYEAVTASGVIYTDDDAENGMNNFEIILSGSGEYKIRRL